MPTENERRRTKVLKVTSYLLLVAGILMVAPYPLFYLIKLVLRAFGSGMFAPGHSFMIFLVAGQLALCAPLFFITYSAIWVWRQTDSPDEKFEVFSRGYLRYLPALFLDCLVLLYTGKTGNAYVPGLFGVLLIVYAWFLLKIDAKGPL